MSDKLLTSFNWKLQRVFLSSEGDTKGEDFATHTTKPVQTSTQGYYTYDLGTWYRGETIAFNISITNILSYDLLRCRVSVFIQEFDRDDQPLAQANSLYNSDKLRASKSSLTIPVRYIIQYPQSSSVQMSISFDCTHRDEIRRLFKIFFRTAPFLKAIDLKVKKRTIHDQLLVEAEITNVSGRELELERVAFDPTEWFTAEVHSLQSYKEESVLAKMDKRNVLFKIRMKDRKNPKNQVQQQTGCVVVQWRIGRRFAELRTDPLNRKKLSLQRLKQEDRSKKGHPDLSIYNVYCPAKVTLQKYFEVHFEIRSNDESKIEAQLTFGIQKIHPLQLVGKQKCDLGVIDPGSSKRATLTLVPLIPGHHTLPNLVLHYSVDSVKRSPTDNVWKKGVDEIKENKKTVRYDPQRTIYVERISKVKALPKTG